MGNSASSGGIYVNLEKPSYLPGETVTGYVFLNITDAIKANSVYIKITGKEATHWKETRTTSNGKTTTTTTVWRHNSFKMFKVQIVLGQFNPKIGFAGKYQFPFQFTLPMGIPGSACAFSADKGGTITYIVKGVLAVEGMLKSNLRESNEIMVKQLYSEPPKAFTMASTEIAKTMFCVHQGHLDFKVTSATNAFYDRIEMIVSISNKSKKNFKQIKFELWQTMHGTGGIGSKKFCQRVARQKYPGIPSMTDLIDTPMSLSIPLSACQSVNGSQVKIFYEVRIRAQLSWGRDCVCSVPVIILVSDKVCIEKLNFKNIVIPPDMQATAPPVPAPNMAPSAPPALGQVGPPQDANDFIRRN